jgi:hypothetical protein
MFTISGSRFLVPAFPVSFPMVRERRVGMATSALAVLTVFSLGATAPLTGPVPGTPAPLSGTALQQSISADGSDPAALSHEGQRPDPADFTPEELRELRRRFGVHGPQPRLAQLFSDGLDQLQPLRTHTLGQIEALMPVILEECRHQHINPMLVTAVLFDELRHAKPGENLPSLAHSGLFSTHGPAQLSLGEMVKQGLLPEDASPEEISRARSELLDPDRNVAVLVAKFVRLRRELGQPAGRMLEASRSPRDAKVLATLAYLHNGKLDYPSRILRHMQDPELHAVVYGRRTMPVSPLI